MALRLVVEGESARHQTDVQFADWDEEIEIAAPDGEVDETPWVDEELLAEVLTTVSPLAPTEVPDGLVLMGLDAISADDAEEMGGEPCDQLSLFFEPPPDTAADDPWWTSPDYLSVYLLPAACALDADTTPFEPGEFGEVPSRETEFGYVEVLVGETVVQIDTTYTDDLPAMVASLQPFDVDAVVESMAGSMPMGGFVAVAG